MVRKRKNVKPPEYLWAGSAQWSLSRFAQIKLQGIECALLLAIARRGLRFARPSKSYEMVSRYLDE
ncbi:hypothetical protein D3H35_08150 [Cohnella faecalis]|uniref:Uncharacterized protein n=1 Tax=Cohnella faecalis TaxID=2315694 RepID=A0A398CKU1_9BACL|nr:hypothetical protein D3H35_08150 [Cohnella faecalis]